MAYERLKTFFFGLLSSSAEYLVVSYFSVQIFGFLCWVVYVTAKVG